MDFAPWPYFGDDEIKAAANVLRSGKVNQWTGDEVISFEKEFSGYIGTKYAVALANGSLALDLALNALGITEDDEVIVTPRSFIASVSCVVLKKAIPVFVDVDPITQNITFENIKLAITKKTKAVILVHLAGWPGELGKIQLFCKENNIALIEDCSQAHGSKFKGKKAGSFGDCSVFSFCQDKIITTGGEGGMLLTDNKMLWEKVWSYKDHGKRYDRVFPRKQEPKFLWVTESFGTNCRMTEFQAAIGRVMLKKLDKWVEKRRNFAELLTQGFENIPGLRVTIPSPDIFHSYYKYYVFIKPDELKKKWNRTSIIEELNKKKIPCDTGACPEIYLEKVFEKNIFKIVDSKGVYKVQTKKKQKSYSLPNARLLGLTSLVFQVHPTLDTKTIQYLINQVRKIMEKACR
ncbi:MAG: DegT/DnrJ/EryC1/StrS aminotransferase family protein [Desulfobacula sp.]|nr:DegT/DnrJ/EryC1/StrS aminotransferase family protein [Desulfobacula sp.]